MAPLFEPKNHDLDLDVLQHDLTPNRGFSVRCSAPSKIGTLAPLMTGFHEKFGLDLESSGDNRIPTLLHRVLANSEHRPVTQVHFVDCKMLDLLNTCS